MKVAVDTSVLVYASAYDDEERRNTALDLLERLPGAQVVTPIQVLAELFNVLTRKLRVPEIEAASIIVEWSSAFAVAEASAASFLHAIEIAAVHQLRIFDALILSTAAEAGCSLLLSEDLHDGFVWNGVHVLNPFRVPRHPAIEALLDEGQEPRRR
jgi:predicted nucleic acid-binding protein